MLNVIDELCMHAYIISLGFHSILLIIKVDDGRFDVMDSPDKDPKVMTLTRSARRQRP
jgi:hypothetical protein